MRRLLLVIAAVAGVLLQTGVAVAAPVLHLSGWKATAGKPETFTITRVGGNGTATVVFKTTDGSAIAGLDYAATSVTISWQPRQTTAIVQVATFVNPAKAGRNISFTASITTNGVMSSATGLIVEPAAIAPLPTAASACPSISDASWQNGGPVSLADETCIASKACSSVWRNSLSDAAGVVFPSTVVGVRYYVNPLTNGLLPSFYSGPAVNAVPIDGAGMIPASGVGDWQFDPSCFQ